MKFGGTSVADLDRIRHVATLVKREVDSGNQVAVTVSAMAGETNKLVAWTRELSPLYDAREYDVIVASGEQVSAGLTAIALQTASEAAFHSASDSYAHGVGTLTDATSAQTGLATARAAVARAHAQSLINGAALAFATGELTSSTDFATSTPR